MNTLIYLLIFLFSSLAQAQFDANKDIIISEKQTDDIYLAGEKIRINAKIDGDAVLAGSNIVIKDTICQDLLVTGGIININGYINDDIRAAGGELILNTNVGDDVIIFGGKVEITKEAVIKGNLIVFSGDIEMNGTINGAMKAYGGKLKINGIVQQNAELYSGELEFNGEIRGTTKIVAEQITIGNNAKFFSNVEYWSQSGEIDFKDSLVNSSSNFNENLAKKHKEFPYQFLGVAALSLWIFYLLSAFLIILILNALLRKFWLKVAKNIDKNLLKGLGYGLIYLFGLPIIIAISFFIIIGIPIGLLLGFIYLFSVLIGHLIASLLITYYIKNKKERSWDFWTLSFITLGIAALLRLVIFIPFLGILISIVVVTITYGIIGITLIEKKKPNTII